MSCPCTPGNAAKKSVHTHILASKPTFQYAAAAAVSSDRKTFHRNLFTTPISVVSRCLCSGMAGETHTHTALIFLFT